MFLSFFLGLPSTTKQLASQVILKWKISFVGKILKKVLRSSVTSLLSAEEKLLTLISNTIFIFIANALLVP